MIQPIFAAFEFSGRADARAAFANLQASKPSNLYACAMQDTETGKFVVAMVGEDQANVDANAKVVMASPNCRGDFMLSREVMTSIASRRYRDLAEAFAKGEGVHRNKSWAAQGGQPMNAAGEPVEPTENGDTT